MKVNAKIPIGFVVTSRVSEFIVCHGSPSFTWQFPSPILASLESKTSLFGLSAPPPAVSCSGQRVLVMVYLHRIIQGNSATERAGCTLVLPQGGGKEMLCRFWFCSAFMIKSFHMASFQHTCYVNIASTELTPANDAKLQYVSPYICVEHFH